MQKKWKLWTEAGRAQLEQIELLPYAAERRRHLLQTLDQLQVEIEGLNQRVDAEARQRPQALALVLTAGTGRTLPFAQASGQLLRADSQRALQRRAPAAAAHYQAGQFVFALPAGGGGPVGGTVRF